MRAYNDGHIFDNQRIFAAPINACNAFLHRADLAAVIALFFAIIHFFAIFSNASRNFLIRTAFSSLALLISVFFDSFQEGANL